MTPRHDPELPDVHTSTPPGREALSRVAARLGLASHVLAGVRGLKRWDDLFPVTDDELLAAVHAFESITLG